MNRPNIIHTVNALAGAGKTYDAIGWALMEAATAHRKTVMVFKSVKLINQAYIDAVKVKAQKKYAVPITLIHCEIHEVQEKTTSVGNAIHDHFSNACYGTGELLMITEAALLNPQYLPKRYLWTCICDEIPEVASTVKANLPENHRLLTDHIKLISDGGKYSEVGFAPGGKAVLTAIAENPRRDEVNKVLAPIAKQIISPIYQSFVLTKQFEGIVNPSSSVDPQQLEVFSLLQPSVFGTGNVRKPCRVHGPSAGIVDAFEDVIIMGARFDFSMLSQIWKSDHLQFKPHDAVGLKLRYTSHPTSHRLRIHYVFETDWSKTFAGKESDLNGQRMKNFEVLTTACSQVFEQDDFLYLVNKDKEKSATTLFNDAVEKLPNSPFGLNCFQHVHNVAILAALNPTPAFGAFLKDVGLTREEVRDALFHSQIYQSVMRSSLRDIEATEEVDVVLPDQSSAFALAGNFPGCSVAKLELNLTQAEAKPLGCPKSKNKKPSKKINHEYHNRQRAIGEEIKRIEEGGAVDEHFVDQLGKCRSDNKRLIRLLEVIDEYR